MNKNNCKKQRHRQHAVKEVKFTQKSVYFSILRKSVELSRILKSLPHIWKENIIMHLFWRSRRRMRWPMIKVKKFSRIWNSLKKAIFFGHSRSFVVAKCQNIKPLSWKCMSQCIFFLFESRPVKWISVRIKQGQADRVTQIQMLNLKWAYSEKRFIPNACLELCKWTHHISLTKWCFVVQTLPKNFCTCPFNSKEKCFLSSYYLHLLKVN